MLDKCVFACVCVGGGGKQGAGKPHPYGETAPQSPIFHKFLPPNTNLKYLTTQLTHTHKQLM